MHLMKKSKGKLANSNLLSIDCAIFTFVWNILFLDIWTLIFPFSVRNVPRMSCISIYTLDVLSMVSEQNSCSSGRCLQAFINRKGTATVTRAMYQNLHLSIETDKTQFLPRSAKGHLGFVQTIRLQPTVASLAHSLVFSTGWQNNQGHSLPFQIVPGSS